jgi:parallel beta-helix repeat protein
MLSLLITVALLLGMSGIVSAQEPAFFTTFTYTPSSPVYVGGTVTYTLAGFYGGGGGAGSDCLEIMIPTAWATSGIVPMVTASSSLVVPLGAMTTPSPCLGPNPTPGNTGGDTVFGVAFGPGPSTPFFDQTTIALSQAFGAGDVGTGWIVRAGSSFGGFGVPSFVDAAPLDVLAAATTRYVANSSGVCGGYTPCDIGPNGLRDALLDATATTVVILGNYQAGPQSNPVLNGETLQGQGGAILGFDSTACTAAAFLTVSGNGTIQDLIVDGTCSGGGNKSSGIYLNAGGSTLIVQDVTIRDFGGAGNSGLYVNAGTLNNTGVTYSNNTVGVTVAGGTATLSGDTFTNNGTGIAISGGAASVTSSSFSGNTSYGVDHTAGTANIGTTPTNGNTLSVPAGATGIRSVGTNATIKDNTISNGSYGIYLNGATASGGIYANTVSGASTYQIGCSGAFVGAGFNYIGGVIAPGGDDSNCSDRTDQLGSPIVQWTDGTSLGTCSVSGFGPIFNLGNQAPYGLAPPLGRDSFYYATTGSASNVSVTGGSTQFKMLMAYTGCNPMTATCWEAAPGRTQSNDGYYFSGSQDPTAITLANVTIESPRLWVPVALAVVVLAGVSGALLLLRGRRGAHL